MFQC